LVDGGLDATDSSWGCSFFPAVTGFTQGVSMSRVLRDARKSILLGTFLAVAVSLCIYVAVAS